MRKSERSELEGGRNKASDEVVRPTCFHLNGFEAYYKFTREKTNRGVFLELRRLRHAKPLGLLLVNCHDVTVGILDR